MEYVSGNQSIPVRIPTRLLRHLPLSKNIINIASMAIDSSSLNALCTALIVSLHICSSISRLQEKSRTPKGMGRYKLNLN